jgi:hypothetical protein
VTRASARTKITVADPPMPATACVFTDLVRPKRRRTLSSARATRQAARQVEARDPGVIGGTAGSRPADWKGVAVHGDGRLSRPAADVVGPNVLREYALLADGRRGALVGPAGNVSWLCVPGWADPPVFTALLRGRGEYLVTPATGWSVWGGHDEPDSLVWRSRWVTTDGIVESREALQ